MLMAMDEFAAEESGSQKGLGARLSSPGIPAAIQRESPLTTSSIEVVARRQHPARISFAVPPLHLLGSAVDDLAFTRDVDAVHSNRKAVAEVVRHVEVHLLVFVRESRQSLL